jgi:hypothetical protein
VTALNKASVHLQQKKQFLLRILPTIAELLPLSPLRAPKKESRTLR